jgi:(2R)-ethylmalonyl-CoA mutase
LREAGVGEVPVVVGGIIPDGDADLLRAQGVAAVFTPKDFALTDVLRQVVDVVRSANGLGPLAPERLPQERLPQ